MDPVLVTIFGFILMLVAIIGISVNGIVHKVLEFKRDKHALRGVDAGGSAQLAQIAERTAHIEDRLAVLERIATDRGQMLADEIEALRLDHRSAERSLAKREGSL